MRSICTYTLKGYILINGFHLFQLRRFLTCSRHNTVGTEVTLMRAREVISCMQAVNTFLYFMRFINSLVYPVPNSSTDSSRTTFNTFPIFFQVTDGISHGMRIFTYEKWFFKRTYMLIHPVHARIHLGVEITETVTTIRLTIACTFIMYRTAIQLFSSVITITEVGSSSGFITQAPENHTRMIAVSQHHPVNTVHE